MPPETAQSTSPAATSGRKSVLFCPECWHESPVDGDWRVQAETDGEVLDCPVCGATVTTRPAEEARDVSRVSPTPAGGSFLARWIRLSFAWTAWPCVSPSDSLPLPAGGCDEVGLSR